MEKPVNLFSGVGRVPDAVDFRRNFTGFNFAASAPKDVGIGHIDSFFGEMGVDGGLVAEDAVAFLTVDDAHDVDVGEAFAAFIQTFEPASSVPYLADVARLEHLRTLAYHAAAGTFKPSEEPNEHREFYGPSIVVTHDEKIIPTFQRLYHIRDGRTVEEAGQGRALD